MSRLIFSLIFLLLFATLKCTKHFNEGKIGPTPPKLLGSSDDMAVVEKGIDAIPEQDGIQLDWQSSNTENIVNFHLYRRATDEEQFRLLRTIAAAETTFVDLDNILLGVRYFYFMTSFDHERRESAPSDTVDYMLVAKAFHLHNTLSPRPTFRWEVSECPDLYVLKLFDVVENEKVWFSLIQSDYTNQDEEVIYNRDGTAAKDSLTAGRSYRWRVDIVGPATNSGSESRWQQFTAGM